MRSGWGIGGSWFSHFTLEPACVRCVQKQKPPALLRPRRCSADTAWAQVLEQRGPLPSEASSANTEPGVWGGGGHRLTEASRRSTRVEAQPPSTPGTLEPPREAPPSVASKAATPLSDKEERGGRAGAAGEKRRRDGSEAGSEIKLEMGMGSPERRPGGGADARASKDTLAARKDTVGDLAGGGGRRAGRGDKTAATKADRGMTKGVLDGSGSDDSDDAPIALRARRQPSPAAVKPENARLGTNPGTAEQDRGFLVNGLRVPGGGEGALMQEKVVQQLVQVCGADASKWNARKPTIDAIKVCLDPELSTLNVHR